MNIKAGVVLVTKFCKSGNKAFKNYVDYIDRDEAVRNEYMEAFNLYNDYMDNPIKSSGLFTADKDSLTSEERKQVKEIFKTAQENDSLMWQTVISFDNEFLRENGIYDSENQLVNEKKLQDLTRGCMNQMLKKENLDTSSFWSAAIHFNTDNIHIHIATVEPFPQRERIKEGKYKGQMKGTFKQASIAAGKRYIVNNILENQVENQKINNIIRENIINNKKKHPLYKDKDLAKKFMEIHSKMPTDKRMWQYGMNAMKDIRPELDELTKMYIEKYHAEDFETLKKILEEQESRYSKAYGGGTENNHMADNKIKELYKGMGNTILKEMKDYDREIKRTAYKEAQTKSKSSTRPLTENEISPYVYVSHTKKATSSSDSTGAPNFKSKKIVKFKSKSNCTNMISALSYLKKALKNKYEHIQNQYEYEAMQREADYAAKDEHIR